MDYTLIAVVLGSVCASLAVTVSVLYLGYRKLTSADFIAEMFKGIEVSDEMTGKQTNATIARTTKTANQMVSRDLMQNTPLSMVLGYLGEETVAYLEEHPEALPGVLKNWAPLLQVAKDLMPVIAQFIQGKAEQKPLQYSL